MELEERVELCYVLRPEQAGEDTRIDRRERFIVRREDCEGSAAGEGAAKVARDYRSDERFKCRLSLGLHTNTHRGLCQSMILRRKQSNSQTAKLSNCFETVESQTVKLSNKRYAKE